ncbi:hypothetical protein OUZ56_005328 [Daphnia magna]|uniref:Uncharacterized protein n=1 Tax=Daphnia magna TaxID=35525 RepID=A0ABQ9YSL2_9CRUS|nr:hypothetical protein OUZ56_005328 [Daphnia magna]
MVLPVQTLAHSFRYDDVKFFDYEHRTNPAYNDNLLNHMNVMADIVAAMNEHPPTEFSLNHQPSASSVLVTTAGVVQYPAQKVIKLLVACGIRFRRRRGSSAFKACMR